MNAPDSNDWIIATHKWCVKADGTPQTMKCQYVTYSDGSGGFFDNKVDEIWNPEEVARWEPLATGEK